METELEESCCQEAVPRPVNQDPYQTSNNEMLSDTVGKMATVLIKAESLSREFQEKTALAKYSYEKHFISTQTLLNACNHGNFSWFPDKTRALGMSNL